MLGLNLCVSMNFIFLWALLQPDDTKTRVFESDIMTHFVLENSQKSVDENYTFFLNVGENI